MPGPEACLLTLYPGLLHLVTGTIVGLAVYGAADRGLGAAALRVWPAMAVAVAVHSF